MAEALDAFAVREKLTGSATAMGRYMVQLFGSKKEPWVVGGPDEVADEDGDHVFTNYQVVRGRSKYLPLAAKCGLRFDGWRPYGF